MKTSSEIDGGSRDGAERIPWTFASWIALGLHLLALAHVIVCGTRLYALGPFYGITFLVGAGLMMFAVQRWTVRRWIARTILEQRRQPQGFSSSIANSEFE